MDNKKRIQKVDVILWISFFIIVLSCNVSAIEDIKKIQPPLFDKKIKTLQQFRNEVIHFTRKKAENFLLNKPSKPNESLHISGNWRVSISLYHEGEPKYEGMGNNSFLGHALEQGVINALKDKTALLMIRLNQSRFLIMLTFLDNEQQLSIIEYNGQGKELIGNLTPIRTMDRNLIRHIIDLSKGYLLRIMHPEKHGFSKKYDVLKGEFDNRLRTIYTASSLYTFLKINELENDPEIEKNIKPIGNFILSMQKHDAPYRGAFYYSYDIITHQNEQRFPVGTTAKTIMTLLKLHEKYKDLLYLDAAKRAGTWLLTMQLPDGSAPVDVKWSDNNWVINKSFSLFYNSQVLTALSRLYKATEQQEYYDGAEKIANLFFKMIENGGYFLRDEYRPKVATISTSWLAMSLLDFNSIHPNKSTKNIIFKCMDSVIAHQLNSPSDIYNYGRFDDTKATSGNGWINEVMAETYSACVNFKRQDCGKYKNSLILTSRWLIQNTYTEENTYHLKSPEKVIGGLIRNYDEEAIRTDSVCHGVNSLIGLMEFTEDAGDELLISVNEANGFYFINK